jgi:hypothetical protein
MNYQENKNLISALIIAIGLIIAAFIYAYGNRYEIDQRRKVVIDKWTAKERLIDTDAYYS